jgi:RimJ/RimL family protein N-acetyltransferase
MAEGDRFVPEDFQPPRGLVCDRFLLEPLGPQHTESDYDAWTSSMEHIHATPGFTDSRWPHPMSLDENRADLERHARDFEQRKGFTYTVLDPRSRDVVGCLYIYGSKSEQHDADVRMWVRASRADLDGALWEAVSAWLDRVWPFTSPDVQGRV